MASGGARAKSGPAPSPTSGVSDRRGLTFKTLPADGYDGPVPNFPMDPPHPPDVRDSEVAETESAGLQAIEARLWEHVWTLPQAAAWASEPWRVYTVAQWVRLAALCETGWAKAADRTAMLRFQEEIGLTGPGLARNGWVIGDGGKAESRPSPARRRSSRDRIGLKVVDGGRA